MGCYLSLNWTFSFTVLDQTIDTVRTPPDCKGLFTADFASATPKSCEVLRLTALAAVFSLSSQFKDQADSS